MFCPNCGRIVDNDSVFCEYCGQSIGNEQNVTNEAHHDMQRRKKKQIKNPGRKLFVLCLLICGAVVSFFWARNEKTYRTAMNEGDQYFLQGEYEKAERKYLQAQDVKEKKKEPKERLYTIYITTGNEEKLRAMEKPANPKAPECEIQDSNWCIDPKIEAEDLFYAYSDEKSDQDYVVMNDVWKQKEGQDVYAKVDGKYCLFDKNGQMVEALGENPWEEDEKKVIFYSLGDRDVTESTVEGYTEDSSLDDQEIYEMLEDLSHPIPIQLVKQEKEAGLFGEDSKKSYGIYDPSREEMGVLFSYDNMGSYSEGYFAVKKDGKWGYVDEDGEEVLPCVYDATWNNHTMSDSSKAAYAVSEGYVVLRRGDLWFLYDMEQRMPVIPAGVFDKILPVKDNTCWVKKDGRWGRLSLEQYSYVGGRTGGNSRAEEDVEAETTDRIEEAEEVEEVEETKITERKTNRRYTVRIESTEYAEFNYPVIECTEESAVVDALNEQYYEECRSAITEFESLESGQENPNGSDTYYCDYKYELTYQSEDTTIIQLSSTCHKTDLSRYGSFPGTENKLIDLETGRELEIYDILDTDKGVAERKEILVRAAKKAYADDIEKEMSIGSTDVYASRSDINTVNGMSYENMDFYLDQEGNICVAAAVHPSGRKIARVTIPNAYLK